MFGSSFLTRVLSTVAILGLSFIALQLLPGDACTAFLGQDAFGDTLAKCRLDLQLDRPLLLRFFDWVSDMAAGRFGTSLTTGTPVAEILAPRVRNTFLLGGTAASISVPLSIGLGVLAAVWRDSVFDLLVSSTVLVAVATPEFVIATILIFVFALELQWLPAISVFPADAPITAMLPSLVLPAVVLSFHMSAHIMRVTRTRMIEALSSDFILATRLRGIRRLRLCVVHALPSALPPVLSISALSIASSLGGVVVIERVFNYPGIGTLTLQAIYDRDMPVLQATVLVFVCTYGALTFLADIISKRIDPRMGKSA
ncbi:ABC transporter permease [Mesorhizobium onobrychidis]|uniref:ABC transporter permease n=1 Tax=Mesorhizobium onobrychidis TaxID=2775404 RepID=A0ABY5QVE1_9HYPH|nr:ABC transporter permease [Mesorhizobium onobrychidis]UVC15185.1 ABC transporter permease [Mesorhizobium onobrychidis]